MTYAYHSAARCAHATAALIALLLWALLASTGAWAGPPQCHPDASFASAAPTDVGAADTRFAPKIRPDVQPARITETVVIDGRLDDAAWQTATRIGGFTEIRPGDQERPPECTEVLVAYDETALYVAFRAYETDPSTIRASMRQRDEIFQDDWVGIILDTYGDAAQAYELFANPYGIQGDLRMATTGGEDVGFDVLYQSDGQITQDGFQVEMAIPFSSLRFPDQAEQAWRINFLRTRPRSSREQYVWATVSRDDPCFLCQFGTIRGLRDIAPGTKLDVIPALVGSQAASLHNADDVTSGLNNARATVEPSVNVRYNLTPSLAAEATVNPDFSQVESDAAQIDVNSTFALSVPERRPFFQEGSDQFQTFMNVVYTRSINAPIVAGKVTGRAGRTSIAYLSAVDEQSPLLLPFEEESAVLDVGRSASNLMRVRRTFGQNSYAGVLVTDRRLLDASGSGTLVSADAKWQMTNHWTLASQVAVSETQEPSSASLTDDLSDASLTFDRGAHTAALDGERFRGTALHAGFFRNGRHYNANVQAESYSPTFRAPSGFVTRNDYWQMRSFQGYTWYFDDAFVERIEPSVFGYMMWNHDGVQKDVYGRVALFALLKGQTSLWMSLGNSRELFRDVQFERLTRWNVEVNSNFSETVRLGADVGGGRSIYRSDDPQVGRRLDASAWATIRPLDRLVVESRLRYASLRDTRADTTFFAGYIGRVKTSLQLTREWSMRLVSQYNHFDGSVALEPLISYRLNPFSVVYLGTTHGYAVPDGADARGRPATSLPVLAATDRQVFFKMQYLFRR